MNTISDKQLTHEQERAWLAQWRAATAVLDNQRAVELANMTEEEARSAVTAVLAMADLTPVTPERWGWSGLIEQQRLFHSLPEP